MKKPLSATLTTITVIAGIISLSLLTGCATSPTGRSQLMLISPESAIVESKTAYLSTVSELEQENKLVNDPKVMDRVATITGRLVHVAKQQYPNTANWEWSVAIIDDPKTVNAWCMAGGRMAVYTGLLNKLKLTDDEFAQVMGHEISHALANHTAERMSRAMATSIGVIAIGAAADNHGAALLGAAAAAKLALELPNSRTAESEADAIGMRLATIAGYEPDAAVTLWQKMGESGGSTPPEFLSTHPAPGNRQAALKAMIPEMRQLNPTGTMAPVAPVQIVR
ncbi:M48 family peptidase [Halioglobus maricola]|uniref:M48 family peptidase n=1 Tax=Halioglobus maricola TaxID=2601894 RepID=A0A5P9NPV3_9GAMM|nr:M48 family metallopeptidase [Halioglobus maricola]QFU77314.1 M48 family peptidase [Halioglobus maricola]